MQHTLKDNFRFNRYSTYRQEEDRECFYTLCPLFFATTDLTKDTKAIIFLSNSQASLTNRVKCGIMFTLHKLHIFSLIRENTLVKSVFSLFSYRIGESLCSNIRGGTFFRCIPSGAVWKNPTIKLTSLQQRIVNQQAIIEADYELPEVSAKLSLTYTINNEGAIKVTQKMTADKEAKVANMFRFGMQMQMPRSFDKVEYYGRGPVENYIDRKANADLGIYRQSVAEQFYTYIRPQETGTKSDLRWWKTLNMAGRGIQVVASKPFSASALHYTIESLDEGLYKKQGHSQEVEEADMTNFCFDLIQAGLGCEDSWGRIARPEYQVPYGDYEFTFILMPM